MEETIYQQVWIRVYAGTMLRLHAMDTALAEQKAADEARWAARAAVLAFDHSVMADVLKERREATDAAMEGK